MRDSLLKYVVAVLAVAVACLGRWMIDPVLGDLLPYPTFFIAVVIASSHGGLRPALLTTVLGLVLARYLFISPRHSFAIPALPDVLGLMLYVVVSGAIALSMEARRRYSQVERRLREESDSRLKTIFDQQQLLQATLTSIGDAVIATDEKYRVTFMNSVAESLTGWTQESAKGRAMDEVFCIVNEDTRRSVENPAFRAIKEGVIVGLANHTILIAKDGTERPIDDSAAPIRNQGGTVSGAVLVFRDISERRTLENEIRHRLADARLLASIVESSDDAIVSKNLDGIIQSWNVAAERIFGFTAQESIGKHVSLIIPAERMSEEEQIIARIRMGERVDHLETIRQRKNGERVLVSLTISPIRDEAGRVVGASKIARDIAKRTHSEESLRQRVEEFQTLLDTLPIGVFIAHDPDCRTISGNPSAHQLLRTENFNLSKSATDGSQPRHFRVFRNGVELSPDQLPVQRAAKGAFIRNEEIDDVFDDGTVLHTLMSAAPLFDREGQVRGAVASVLDVTEKTIAEQKLAESQRFLRASLDALESHIAVLDESGIILEVNKGWRRFADDNQFVGGGYGVGVNYLIICDDFARECVDGRAIAEGLREVLRGDREYFQIEYPCHSPTEQRWCLMRATRFPTPGPVRVVVAHDDITEQKRAEITLREADRRKNEFLATLAHELRNPLAPIRNGLQLMGLAGGDHAAMEQTRIMMERQLVQMVRLIDDLMDVTRISSGKLELRFETFPLETAITSAIETSRPLIEEMGHELTVQGVDQPIVVRADSTRLSQVLMNLLNNAAKYTNRSGHIRLTIERQGRAVLIVVKDDGIGLAPDQIPKIFELFCQLNNSLEKTQGGLGIGLNLVKQIVQLHNGQIEVRSEGLGKGSEFSVRLPIVVDTPSAPAESDGEHHSSTKSRLRILVVDDNRDGAESLSMMLRFLGNETRTAYDGEEGVAAADDFRPHVIFLDIGLPKLNGYDVCRQIRNQPWCKNVLIVAVTGWGQAEDRRRSQEAGFDHHMVKPVNSTALMKLLADHQASRA